AGLQNHFGVGLADLGNLLLRPFEVPQQVGFATPQTKAAADELGAHALEHAEVVIQVALAVQQPLHRDRARQVVLQNLPRDGPVKIECVFKDEINHRLRVLGSGWKMSLTLLQDNRDWAAEFLVSLFEHPGLALKPGIEAAANV